MERHFSGVKSAPAGYFALTSRDSLNFWEMNAISLKGQADAAQLLAGKFDLKAKMFHTLEEAIVALGLAHHKSEIFQLWEQCRLEFSETGSEASLGTAESAA